MQDTGIVLLAHGKKGYGLMAFNLAMSIKEYGCDLPIHVFAQQQTFDGVPLGFFNSITWINPDFYTDYFGHFSVAKSKIEVLNNLPFKHNIYLDVDGMALKNINQLAQDLINFDKPYLTDVMGTVKYGDNIQYDCWSKHDFAWPFFGLSVNDTWRTIQSSWAYFKKGEFVNELYLSLSNYLRKGYPLNQTKEKWATGQLPDELLFTGVCAKINYDPSFNQRPVFFGHSMVDGGMEVVKKSHYVLSMYGNGATAGRTLTKQYYQDYYSKEMKIMSKKHRMPWFGKEYVMRDKIINT